MICPRCNKTVPDTTTICPVCDFHFEEGVSYNRPELMGYSDVIKDSRLAKRSRKGKIPFIIVGYAAALLFFLIPFVAYYANSDMLAGYVIFGLLGGVFFAFLATLQIRQMRLGKTWDGKIIDKDIEIRQEKKNEQRILKLLVRKEDDSEDWISFSQGTTLTNYYHIDDKVRHHSGFHYFEKYDKSQDTKVICISCGNLNNMGDTACEDCHLPLLK